MPPTCVEAKFSVLSLVNEARLVGMLPTIPELPLKSRAVSDTSPPRLEGICPDRASEGRLSLVTVRVVASQVTPRHHDDALPHKKRDALRCVKFQPTRAERAEAPIAM